MELDLDTFLTTVYVMVDELYTQTYAPQKPSRRGHRPELADSEVLTLALLAQWHRGRSEAAFLRYAARHWRGYFPRLLSPSAFNRRARDLSGVLSALGVGFELRPGDVATRLNFASLDSEGRIADRRASRPSRRIRDRTSKTTPIRAITMFKVCPVLCVRGAICAVRRGCAAGLDQGLLTANRLTRRWAKT